MKTSSTNSKFESLSSLATLLAFSLLMLSGCSNDTSKADTDAHADHDHEAETAYIALPHSHDTAGETCFICDASKRDAGRLWCKEHDRYEDRCWLCHPELEDKERMWCKEHSLYEDECHLCHPELKKNEGDSASIRIPAESAKVGHALFCNEHNLPEEQCGICQPDLAASLLPGGEMKIRFLSEASASKAGIQTEFPRMNESAPAIEALCETQYNLNTMAKVTPLVGGVIRTVYKDVGEKVEAGDPLVEIHSVEVASAKSTYLSAVVELDILRQSYERENRLQQQRVTSEKELLEARGNFRKSQLTVDSLRQRLINLGLGEDEIARVENERDTSALFIVRAPFSGTLVGRKSVMGESVEAGHPLFTLADLSTRWLEISVPSNHVGQLRAGQPVEAVFADLPNVRITGSITWVDTSIDPNTRMIRARALITENTEKLTSGLYGKIYIAIGDEELSATISKQSIQRHGGSDFVFVQNAADLFALRRVSLGSTRDGNVQVLAGLSSTDSVVTEGSFVVMSEFLKSRLGAGCVDD